MAGRPKAAITRAEFSKLFDRLTARMPRFQEPAVKTNGDTKNAGKNDKIHTAIAARILQVVGYDCRLAAGPVDYRDEVSLGRGEAPQVWPLGNWPFVVFPDGNIVDVCGYKRSPVYVQQGKILWGRPFIVHNSLAYNYNEAPAQTRGLEKIAATFFADNPHYDQHILDRLDEIREEKSPEARAKREAEERQAEREDTFRRVIALVESIEAPFTEDDLYLLEDVRGALSDLDGRISAFEEGKPKRKAAPKKTTVKAK